MDAIYFNSSFISLILLISTLMSFLWSSFCWMIFYCSSLKAEISWDYSFWFCYSFEVSYFMNFSNLSVRSCTPIFIFTSRSHSRLNRLSTTLTFIPDFAALSGIPLILRPLLSGLVYSSASISPLDSNIGLCVSGSSSAWTLSHCLYGFLWRTELLSGCFVLLRLKCSWFSFKNIDPINFISELLLFSAFSSSSEVSNSCECTMLSTTLILIGLIVFDSSLYFLQKRMAFSFN